MIKKKFKIKGMHCTSCAMNIDFDLEDVDGIKYSRTSYASQITEIEYENDKVSEEKILETVKKTGYTAIPHDV